jgi:hypothetical protein
MSLVDDVKLLKGSQVRPSEAETLAAALRVMAFLDRVLYKAQVWTLPRGYHYDVTAGGAEQLCIPTRVGSEEEAARIFASDVATGWLEELCEVLGAQRSARIRSELGL